MTTLLQQLRPEIVEALEKNNELKNEELQLSNGFSGLINFNLRPHYFTWYDTGNIEGYMNANNNMNATNNMNANNSMNAHLNQSPIKSHNRSSSTNHI